jgi:ABC-2 type transport system permease protein
MRRRDPLLPNTFIVARREYAERVRNRLFLLSTLLLATLAVVVAFSPLFVRALDRGTVTRIAVVASDESLADRSISVLDGVLNSATGGGGYEFVRRTEERGALDEVRDGRADAALLAVRQPGGRLSFEFHVGERMGADRAQLVSVGTLAVAILDWTPLQAPGGGSPFQMPALDVIAAGGPGAGGQPISGAEYAGRRILGIVFVFIIFLTVVIYGMWVAAGVVAEKASRVMELIISAASARQLVIGKVLGIGLAGLTQNVAILAPALAALAIEDTLAVALLGSGPSIVPSLAALSPELLLAYATFFVLGFALYALVYAAAGSLISRTEDLQMLALPLSIVAIGGYLMAILALTGGTTSLIRLASYIPFWSPFVMPTRLTVGRVEGWELALSLILLAVTIAVTLVVAVRVYAAGVLLYGQKPGLRAIVAAARGVQ